METPTRVLLVDDEPSIRRIFSALITDFGYDVCAVESAHEALHLLEKEAFPLIITDIRMPGMDGLTLLRHIHQHYPDAQVVMITGHGDMDVAIECLRFGAADFITKPINDDILEHAIRRAEEQYSLRKQVKHHTEHLEELVAQRTKELLDTHRVAVIGETVACMAHTIKNLAAALDGSLFVLKQGMETGNSDYINDGWTMLEEDISRVRNTLLDLLHSGMDSTVHTELTPPLAPIQTICKRMQGRAECFAINLSIQELSEQDNQPLPLDTQRIEACLLNLVGNAFEAFPPQELRLRPAKVVIGLRRTPEQLIYSVMDNGTGLSAEAAERLREGLFTTKKNGTGFGLLGTKKTLLEMNGQLEWENIPNSGAAFHIILPL